MLQAIKMVRVGISGSRDKHRRHASRGMVQSLQPHSLKTE